jgi:hypothetical protein
MIVTHLVEPNMAIQRSPAAEKYDRLIEERNHLRKQLETEGVGSLDDRQKTQIVLVNVMEAELDKNCRRIAGEKITERAHSTKLSQRFLCAVWPRHLDVRPTDGWVMQKARDAALAFYDKSLADVRRVPEPQDYTLASVLEGNLRVMKPLTLAKPKVEK